MEQEEKKRYGSLMVLVGVVSIVVGFYVYLELLATDPLPPDYLSQVIVSSGVFVGFSSIVVGFVVSLIGLTLLIDWYRSKRG
ncbi:MAG: hypothetical protein JSW05_10050 [Candidatus Thorarchaeota archaeon]|nr:MAG: hypothetical protein JSW05_10050 [Candidatus Thorarchaeota archaeon]